jgi:hypothetical protein
MTQRRRQAAPLAGQAPGGQDVDAWKTGRTIQPRSQQGTSLLVAMQVMATDECQFLARVAFKDATEGGRVKVCHDTLELWQPLNVREHFSYGIGGAVMDAVMWTVS